MSIRRSNIRTNHGPNQPHPPPLINPSAAPPAAAPEPTGAPITYTFQGVVPPPNVNRDPKLAFDYPAGTPATVAGSIRLAPRLGVQLWRVAGATVVVNMTNVRRGLWVGVCVFISTHPHSPSVLTNTPETPPPSHPPDRRW